MKALKVEVSQETLLGVFISFCYDKIPHEGNLKGKGFISAQKYRLQPVIRG